MAIASYTAVQDITTDANTKAWAQGLSTALQSLASLTKVNDLAALVGTAGSAPMDFTDVTATGVTVTAGANTFSGTFSRSLTAQDVGRQIRIPMGTAGALVTTFIVSVTGAGAGTMNTNATIGIAGTGTATIGVLAPTGTTTHGFEIYRFNDTQQTTCPMYLKIIYGGTTAGASVTIQIGQGTNGFGSLTGVTSTAQTLTASGTDASARLCWASGAAGRLQVALFVNASVTTNRIVFSVARSVDTSGANDDRYIHTFTVRGTITSQILPKIGGGTAFPATPAANVMVAIPNTNAITSASYGGVLGVFPVHPFRGRADNPTMDGCAYFTADIPDGNTVTVTMYGSTRTFFAIGLNSSGVAGSAPGGRSGAAALMLRYE